MRAPSTSLLAFLVGLVAGALVMVLAGIGVLVVLRGGSVPDDDELAGRFGVEVVRVDEVTCEGGDAIGCFDPLTPDRVTIANGLGELERSVLLHELAHVLQHRAGMPLDECGADRIALELGATWTGYDC